jgi:hypothetical protein
MKTMIVNILLAAVCVITCADVIRRYSDPVDPIRATQASLGLGPAHGSIMRLGGERWDDRRTFVIAVSPGCHSCTASAPFYRKLLDAARMHRVPVIVLGQDPESVTRVYLRGLGLARRIECEARVLLYHWNKVDPHDFACRTWRRIENTWPGVLSGSGETEVLSALDPAVSSVSRWWKW